MCSGGRGGTNNNNNKVTDLKLLYCHSNLLPKLSYLATIGHIEYNPRNLVSLVLLCGKLVDFVEGSDIFFFQIQQVLPPLTFK